VGEEIPHQDHGRREQLRQQVVHAEDLGAQVKQQPVQAETDGLDQKEARRRPGMRPARTERPAPVGEIVEHHADGEPQGRCRRGLRTDSLHQGDQDHILDRRRHDADAGEARELEMQGHYGRAASPPAGQTGPPK
jgi:hypothetical protein